MRSANDIGDSTTMGKFTVCLVGFGFSCLAFLLSATVLVPVTGFISNVFGLPDIVPQVLILLELFGLPVVAALVGVSVAARPDSSSRSWINADSLLPLRAVEGVNPLAANSGAWCGLDVTTTPLQCQTRLQTLTAAVH